MPLDAIFLSALTGELREKLIGAKIDRIQMPERDMLLFTLRGRGESLRLLIAAGTGNARVHLTNASFENPAQPPMFCMLLRKHLIGARIVSLTQPVGERLVVFELETHDELGLASRKTMIAELIGRSANLILVDAEGRILDCLRRMDFGGDALRRMLPGMIYRFPPRQDKPVLTETGEEEREALLAGADRDKPIDRWLLDSFSGLSPLICRELGVRCGGEYSRLGTLLDAFVESVRAWEFNPCLYYDGKRPLDYSFMHLKQFGPGVQWEEPDSFSELLDRFYTGRDKLEQQRRRSRELTKTVRTL